MNDKPLSQEVAEIAKELWKEPGQQGRALRLEVVAKRFQIVEEFLAKWERKNEGMCEHNGLRPHQYSGNSCVFCNTQKS